MFCVKFVGFELSFLCLDRKVRCLVWFWSGECFAITGGSLVLCKSSGLGLCDHVVLVVS